MDHPSVQWEVASQILGSLIEQIFFFKVTVIVDRIKTYGEMN